MNRNEKQEHLFVSVVDHQTWADAASSGLTEVSSDPVSSFTQKMFLNGTSWLEEETPSSMLKLLKKQDSFLGFRDESTYASDEFGDFCENSEKQGMSPRYELKSLKDEWTKHGFTVAKAKLVHMLSSRQLVEEEPNTRENENEDEACFSLIEPSRPIQDHRQKSLCTIGRSEIEDAGGKHGDNNECETSSGGSSAKKLEQHVFRPPPRRSSSLTTADSTDATAPVSARPITTSSGETEDKEDDDQGCFSYIMPSSSQRDRVRGSLLSAMINNGESDEGGDDFTFGGDESMGDFGKFPGTIHRPEGEEDGGTNHPNVNAGGRLCASRRMQLVRMTSLRHLQVEDGDEVDLTVPASNEIHHSGRGGQDSSFRKDQASKGVSATECEQVPSRELSSRSMQLPQAATEQQRKFLGRLASSYHGDETDKVDRNKRCKRNKSHSLSARLNRGSLPEVQEG